MTAVPQGAMMNFTPTKLGGVFLVEPERREDERGFFARTWCREEFEAHGLEGALSQCSISFNTRRGTLRGMHLQAAPHEEAKLVRCTAGAIFDVALDLRSQSPTYGQWVGVELSAHNRQMFYIPAGVAHGFQTLTDGAEVLYQISTPFVPEAARGYRYDDPAFGIVWPEPVTCIADKDLRWPAHE